MTLPPTQVPQPPNAHDSRLKELDVSICPRENTVAKLAELIAERTVVHVRGTPSSGKSILALLLERYYTTRGVHCLLLLGWTAESDPINKCITHYTLKYGGAWDRFAFMLGSYNPVFIIDEAQESYVDRAFWMSVLKSQSGRGTGPRFCLFSSYGSPSTGISELSLHSTPIRFSPQQRVSLVPSRIQSAPPIGLFYTKNEFLDVVNRQIATPGWSSFSLSGDARAYLFAVTNGHPAGVAALIDYIYEVRVHHHRHAKAWKLMDIDLPC
jgi:hypothetical protein